MVFNACRIAEQWQYIDRLHLSSFFWVQDKDSNAPLRSVLGLQSWDYFSEALLTWVLLVLFVLFKSIENLFWSRCTGFCWYTLKLQIAAIYFPRNFILQKCFVKFGSFSTGSSLLVLVSTSPPNSKCSMVCVKEISGLWTGDVCQGLWSFKGYFALMFNL